MSTMSQLGASDREVLSVLGVIDPSLDGVVEKQDDAPRLEMLKSGSDSIRFAFR